jgi:putative serine/threonine protein kinase
LQTYSLENSLNSQQGSITPLNSNPIVPLIDLVQEPYASVLCFPKVNETELQSRIEEMRILNVSAIEFCGKTSVYGVRVPVIGKGFVGIVVVAHVYGERLALKIRRLDADRLDLTHEAEMLRKANLANVAPKLVAASKNFLLMQLIDGELLPNWLKANRGADFVLRVLRQVLESCYRLDELGLDHGELSKAPKHVIVDRQLKPWIVDFETASDERKPANVPAMCHFLFTSTGEVARSVAEVIGERKREQVVSALQGYKRNRNRASFDAVLSVCLGSG